MSNKRYVDIYCPDCGKVESDIFIDPDFLADELEKECGVCGARNRKKKMNFSAGLLRTTGFTKKIIK